MNIEESVDGSLRSASGDSLACLFRHWTWADEARARFERELANEWDFDEQPVADYPFGAYYHWCALLCGFSEAALEHGLLSTLQLDAIRRDLEAGLPGLRAYRQWRSWIWTSMPRARPWGKRHGCCGTPPLPTSRTCSAPTCACSTIGSTNAHGLSALSAF